MTEKTDHYLTRCKAFEADNLDDLELELNEYFNGKWVTASPIFYTNNKWQCMVYYKILESQYAITQKLDKASDDDQDIPEEHKASDKQIAMLKRLNYQGSFNLTKRQAYTEIKYLMEKKHK